MGRKEGISRTIVKSMGLFGGVQIANILCAIIRTKLVAVWIGPAGIGLFSLFNNAAEMVSSITSLGIRNSAVRDVAVAAESHDALRLGRVIAVIKRWSWFVSIFGAAVMIAIAPLLSDFTFGSYSRTWDFILLSCVLMFYGLVNGEQTILQGVSSLRRLAHASVWGVAAGLLISIPLFYFWGIDSIVTSIVVYQAMLLLFTWIFRHKDYERVRLSAKEAFTEGKEFVKLGIFLTLSGFITTLFSYAFSVYLNRTSGTAEVGFFQAGYTLVNKYVGLIFTAIGME
ncbi:MAG: oligosaccharide flippase family protein, partial [Bacteroidetes bacterium]|nr:oligosaccharide flippase family protein [Candidatus Limisoma faecipullorum]